MILVLAIVEADLHVLQIGELKLKHIVCHVVVLVHEFIRADRAVLTVDIEAAPVRVIDKRRFGNLIVNLERKGFRFISIERVIGDIGALELSICTRFSSRPAFKENTSTEPALVRFLV